MASPAPVTATPKSVTKIRLEHSPTPMETR